MDDFEHQHHPKRVKYDRGVGPGTNPDDDRNDPDLVRNQARPKKTEGAPDGEADVDVVCQVKCKNVTGAEIYSFSQPLSVVKNRTPHGEVQKMLAARGDECAKDCLAEAAKRVGSGKVLQRRPLCVTGYRPTYYRGLGDRCRVPSPPRDGYSRREGGEQQTVSLFAEQTFVFPDTRGHYDWGNRFVSAELIIRDMRLFLVFILEESWKSPVRGRILEQYEVVIEADRNGFPQGCLPLREGDSVSGGIFGLKLDVRLLHNPKTDGRLQREWDPKNPCWEFPFLDKARAATAWATIERACSLLHEIDADPTRLMSDFPQYQKITPGMIGQAQNGATGAINVHSHN